MLKIHTLENEQHTFEQGGRDTEFFTEFIGVTLIHKTIQVSSVPANKTSSTYCIPCSLPRVKTENFESPKALLMVVAAAPINILFSCLRTASAFSRDWCHAQVIYKCCSQSKKLVLRGDSFYIKGNAISVRSIAQSLRATCGWVIKSIKSERILNYEGRIECNL